MSVLIRSLTVLRVLRTIEQRGLAGLQIMLCFSWYLVCIESGSNQLLTTSYVAALRLLERFLKEVLDACQDAGLRVVATVCNMAANIVKALRLLGATRRKPFFTFQNREIVTVYDPPHLLKCTRNLFLKYDVQFESELMHNKLPVTAKWEHISNVYNWDKQNIVCACYKLTDAHLTPLAQNAMKVSLAAQVMSHTVGATPNTIASQGNEHCSVFIVL